ncbi:hypothetical protein SLS62_001040 [Diatrype stigma]|uniref:Uncharacterized protein n=1 Tax=Diatrype stigma TaxID=117547 RepID=A0AAN9YWJ3_9PEZI
MQFTLITAAFSLAASVTALGPRLNETLSARGADGLITCGATTNCRQSREREAMVEGQHYLHHLGDVCGMPANKCERVSCSNDAAIWLCSDDGQEHHGIACGELADYVDHIYDQCQTNGQLASQTAYGMQVNSGGWRVEVGKGDC